MNRRAAFLLVAISPEIVAYVVVVCVCAFFPNIVFNAFDFVAEDIKWLWGAVLVPVGIAAASISKIDGLLSPKGKRALLLSWPDYRLFKDLAIAVLGLYCFGLVVAAIGFYVVAITKHPYGLVLIFAALVQVLFTFATLLLACWKSREILGE